jgi:N-acetylmuramoyl-L-alanine amidase
MYRKLFSILFFLCSLALTAGAAGKQFVLVIDAGHGGHDTGAPGAFSKEKTINLNVALAFGRYVEQNCPDVKVIYTRKTDTFVTLEGRAAIANKHKADLFVSIHTNALEGGRISRGLETYTLGMHRAKDNLDVAMRENSVILIEKDYKQRYQGFNPKSSESYIIFELMQDQNMAQSVEMAKLVQQKVCATAGRQNKGVKQAGFLVLRETSMPSCLIELGFITTPDEERYLNSPAGIDALGRGIYQAFVAYKKKGNQPEKVPYRNTDETAQVTVPTIAPPPPAANQPATSKKSEKATEEKPVQQPRTAPEAAADSSLQTPPPAADNNQKEKTPAEIAPKAPAETTPKAPAAAESQDLVFKVQILASSAKLKAGNQQFKGLTGIGSYEENGMTKYTVGECSTFEEANKLRRSLSDKFPQAFVVAFSDGKRIDASTARRMQNTKKK